MYRLGHTGIALFVLAPLCYVLFEAHKPLLAIVIVLGVVGIEPLPDADFKLSFLRHRGVSHSLLAAVSVGGILAIGGWVLAEQVSTALPSLLTAISEVTRTGATTLQSFAPSGTSTRIAGLLTVVADALIRTGNQLQALDHQTVAGVGFTIGAGGILIHLLGDMITVSGIQPLLPLSKWRVSLSSLRANSTLANIGLFAIGALAVAVVLVTTVMGFGIGGAPAAVSPVGAVDAQETPGAQNGSGQNTTTPAVKIRNQTNSGGTVTVQRATLSQPGFVAIHTSSYADGLVGPNESIIAVSQRLAAGTHRNVTIDVSNAPPGNAPGLNRSQLNETTTLAATVYADTNDNVRLDSVRSLGENDTLVTANGSVVRDSARVRVPSPPRRTASVVFRNQTLQNDTLTVAKARLPRGGFLIAHNGGGAEVLTWIAVGWI
jgi:membrane-bound metal-dependent hydrolase YbcI (DUF457 family)